jgi:hypothetical protein
LYLKPDVFVLAAAIFPQPKQRSSQRSYFVGALAQTSKHTQMVFLCANFPRCHVHFDSYIISFQALMTDENTVPNSLESENDSPTQVADKLSTISSRKISLDSNGSHQASSPSASTTYPRVRPNREVLVAPALEEYVSCYAFSL